MAEENKTMENTTTDRAVFVVNGKEVRVFIGTDGSLVLEAHAGYLVLEQFSGIARFSTK